MGWVGEMIRASDAGQGGLMRKKMGELVRRAGVWDERARKPGGWGFGAGKAETLELIR